MSSMTHCLQCLYPGNPSSEKVCRSCGSKLLLMERYRPVDILGQGGFGRTFLAIDSQLPSQPECVIKQLYWDPQNSQRSHELFQREAQQLDNLGQHGQIPRLLAYFEQDEQLYLIQELIPGDTLARALEVNGQFSFVQVEQLLLSLLPVLEFIHDRRVIHRDIKLSNIIRRSHDHQYVLIDFGIAKVLSDTIHTGTIAGTCEYMAPEQLHGKVFPATDLYSLGVTCLALLTKKRPTILFDVVEQQWHWRQHLGNRHPPAALANVLDKMIMPRISDRYQSASQALADLQPSPQKINPAPPPPAEEYPAPLESDSLRAGLIQRSTPKLNYDQLKLMLVKKKWHEADALTWDILHRAIGKAHGKYLSSGDLVNTPCEVFQMLDSLWAHFSQNRFGFVTQSVIFDSVGRDYAKFCRQVGWPVHQPTEISDQGLKFRSDAPRGHLPSRRIIGGYESWRYLEVITNRLQDCQIIDLGS